MLGRTVRRGGVALSVAAALLVSMVGTALAVPEFPFATPIFGLAARGRLLYVADAGQGIVRLGAETGRVVVEMRNVVDVGPLKRGRMWALTGGQRGSLWRVVYGEKRRVANVGRFEAEVNPDGGEIDSNPFDLQVLGAGQVLVADAAGNSVVVVDHGEIDWVATLPNELVSTQNAKDLVGCPDPPPDFADICELPDEIEAQAVPTSVAVGPDGAYYVTELKGFPFPLDESKIWRIEPGSRHVVCGTDPECTVVADGFTSIVDLNFAPDGTAYVVEIDESSAFAVELEKASGGTVDACDTSETPWTCTEAASGLTIPIAVAIKPSGRVFAAVGALIPEAAQVIEIGATE